MKKYLAAILSVLIFYSCQKEFTLTDGIDPTPPPGSGGGTNTGCNTYFPTTTGSTWTFDQNGKEDIITIVLPDTTINGNVFKRITSTSSVPAFMREENGNVYEYAGLGATGNILINPLRTSADIGATWGDTLVLNGIQETIQHQMLEKNISLQVDTFHFSDVIHTRYRTTFNSPPIFNNEVVASTDVWYGKCVGVVQTKTVSLLGGVVSDTIVGKIKSYSIK